MRFLRLLTVLLLLLALQGCSWIKSWGKDDDDPGSPAELVEFNTTLATREVWSRSVGAGIGKAEPQLRPAYWDGSVYAADYKGRVMAIDAESGSVRWEVKTELPLSGGPGINGENLFIGTENGEVHTLSTADGTLLWTAQVSSEILAAPVAGDGVVVIRCVDGRIFGLDEDSGRRLWIYDRSVPLLTLRGNSVPVIWAGVAYVGYDGGEVVALNLETGTVIWEQTVVTSEGRSELERLSDIDGDMVYVASDLIVSSYKNRLASLAADSGRLLWFKDIASATGVVVDRTNLAISDRQSHLWLLDRRNGSTIWKHDQLENRQLTRPGLMGNFVVVGDFEGYLHWISLSDGNVAAREKVGGDGFVTGPLVVGNRMFALTRKGKLVAYSVGGEL
ncbi:MAG: outer membrane protein assembly factor BamB [Thiohalobacterales bacterium]|nr:outer membrane protein assembly factor BamB [Thiohalobacterales bacterium]